MSTVQAAGAPLSRPDRRPGPLAWLRRNLFNSWLNALLTVASLWLIARLAIAVGGWLGRADWRPIVANLPLYAVGQYPAGELWRVGAALLIVSFLFGLSWGAWGGLVRSFAVLLIGGYGLVAALPLPAEALSWPVRLFCLAAAVVVLAGYGAGRTGAGRRRVVILGWLFSAPAVVILLRGLAGSVRLPAVETTLWGGLLVNLLLAAVGIAASFPLGVLLALGRRSSLPVVRVACVAFIELVRGVPLVTILFMASIMLPLFLPEEVRVDRLLRALLGIMLFSAAYIAENVRGGLQAIPLGQYDAAKAIGLNGVQTTLLIVLPQALRLVIPALVGQFISLFKDTTLVVIVGILELLGIAKSIVLGNPEYQGAQAEVYLFVAGVFWLFTFSMSQSARRLEKALGVGVR
jgi:general L-amino acid transport system permease protein